MKHLANSFYLFLSTMSLKKSGFFILASLLGFSVYAHSKEVSSSSPVGGNWESQVKTYTKIDPSESLTQEQINAVNVIDNYFNGLTNLQGRFVQIDPNSNTTKGKFFVQKPGKFRFDYSAPSKKVIISDGRFLAIQDLDLRNEDVYELSNTPFRILLRDNVDLLKDARILNVEVNEVQISVQIAEKSAKNVGRIKVIMSLHPKISLLGWVTTDGQGQNTSVSVSELLRPDVISSDLFKRKALFHDAANSDAR
ncbi:MAG: Outer-membrane lipoprotein carrier protein [Hyphomicrobiaceae bacterium hypho_1]